MGFSCAYDIIHPEFDICIYMHKVINGYRLMLSNEGSSLSEEVTQLHADICSALADPRRILLLYALDEHPYTVSDLAEEIRVSQPSTSRHLKILRERGLVRAVRQGTSVEYNLTDRRLIQALDLLRDVLRDRLTYRASLIEDELASD
jgi:DNA-binding transcriptional ArsR family regulator